jgi:hypothetical protein
MQDRQRSLKDSAAAARQLGIWNAFARPGAEKHDPAAASTETAMFRDVAATLVGLRVPVVEIDTGSLSPQQAANQIADALSGHSALPAPLPPENLAIKPTPGVRGLVRRANRDPRIRRSAG